jgi:hypothetical protein
MTETEPCVPNVAMGLGRSLIPADPPMAYQPPTETRLPGWACKTRTGESVRELSDWNSVATSPQLGASGAAETFACELRDPDSAALRNYWPLPR